jgi:hypothetical protein
MQKDSQRPFQFQGLEPLHSQTMKSLILLWIKVSIWLLEWNKNKESGWLDFIPDEEHPPPFFFLAVQHNMHCSNIICMAGTPLNHSSFIQQKNLQLDEQLCGLPSPLKEQLWGLAKILGCVTAIASR